MRPHQLGKKKLKKIGQQRFLIFEKINSRRKISAEMADYGDKLSLKASHIDPFTWDQHLDENDD